MLFLLLISHLADFILFKVQIKDCVPIDGLDSESIICAGGTGKGVCEVKNSSTSHFNALIFRGTAEVH